MGAGETPMDSTILAELARPGSRVEVWTTATGFKGGAWVQGTATGGAGGAVDVTADPLDDDVRCVAGDIRPPPPPPPADWSANAVAGDRVEMQRGKIWWPMRVSGRSGGLLRVRSAVPAYAKKEG